MSQEYCVVIKKPKYRLCGEPDCKSSCFKQIFQMMNAVKWYTHIPNK